MIEKTVVLKSIDEAEEIASNQSSENNEETPKESSSPKKVTLDDLGLTVKPLDASTRKSVGEENGVVVENVDPYGPAFERGLTQGDVILSVGSERVTNPDQFKAEIKKLNPGDAVMLRVKGSDKTVRYVAIEKPK